VGFQRRKAPFQRLARHSERAAKLDCAGEAAETARGIGASVDLAEGALQALCSLVSALFGRENGGQKNNCFRSGR